MKKNLSDFGFVNSFLFEYKGLKKNSKNIKNNANISKNVKIYQKMSKYIKKCFPPLYTRRTKFKVSQCLNLNGMVNEKELK